MCDHAHIAIEAATYIHVNYNTYFMSLLHFCDYAGFQQPQMYCKEIRRLKSASVSQATVLARCSHEKLDLF